MFAAARAWRSSAARCASRRRRPGRTCGGGAASARASGAWAHLGLPGPAGRTSQNVDERRPAAAGATDLFVIFGADDADRSPVQQEAQAAEVEGLRPAR